MRWSLEDAPADTLDRLHSYVEGESFARFAGLSGLRFKSWRARAGEWFEGTYVFVDDATRAAFQERMETEGADLPGSAIVGSPPVLIEPCEIVAVVRGPSGFRSSASFER